MNKLINKLLGLNVLIEEMVALKKENESLSKALRELNEKVDEIPDMDNYVSEDDVNDRIESYINDNDIVSQSYVDDEIESKVNEAIENEDIDSKIESAIEDLDIENTVAEAIDKMDSRPDRKVEEMVKEAVKVTLERVVKAMADQQG